MTPVADLPLTDGRGRRQGPLRGRTARGLAPETLAWKALCSTSGGLHTHGDVIIIDRLVRALNDSGIAPKIVALYPFLGTSENTWAVPLYDRGGKGKAFVTGFVDADNTRSGGMVGNGSTKWMDTGYLPSELGTTNNGGLGWYGLDFNTTGTTNSVLMGCSNTGATNYFCIRTHPSPQTDIIWGATANNAVSTGGGAYLEPGHVYGQRSSSTSREIFINGASLATNTTSDAASGASDRSIQLFGWELSASQYYAGAAGVAYLTDGTLTSTEVALMHSILRETLLIPTGRIGRRNSETALWESRVRSNSGTLASDSIQIADNLVTGLKSLSSFSKIKWLLPLLGSNLAAARVPLIDTLSDGIAGNSGFVDGDFSQSVGLTSTGTQYLTLGIGPNDLNSGNGGAGAWFKQAPVGNAAVGGRIPAGQLFGIAASATNENFYWGDGDCRAFTGVAGGQHHYYGNRASSTDLKLFRNGTLVATDAGGGTSTPASSSDFICFGYDTSFLSANRLAVMYLTDGTLSDDEAAMLHLYLNVLLITATGR